MSSTLTGHSPSKDNLLVVPHEHGWAVKEEHKSKISYVFNSKDVAVLKAREIAQKMKVKLIIRGENGDTQKVYSYDGGN